MNAVSRIATLALPLIAVATATAQNLVLEPHVIRDPGINNLVAGVFLKPKGWNVTGGVKWYPNHLHQACVEVKVTSPNGIDQIETLPWCFMNWYSNPVIPMERGYNYMGSIIMEPMTPKEVIEKLTIPATRRGARIVDVQDLPDVAKQLSKLNGDAKVISQRIRIEYALSGQAVEEDIYFSIYYTSANLGVNNCVAYLWGPAWTPFSLRAAKGKLDSMSNLLLPLISSGQFNPKWLEGYYEVCNLFRKRMNQSIQNAKAISDTITRNSNEIFNIISSSYWNRQASQERAANNFSDYVRGVTRYSDPYQTYPVQLPSGYKYAWVNSNGSYVLSNDANYDPNLGSTTSWKLMETVR